MTRIRAALVALALFVALPVFATTFVASAPAASAATGSCPQYNGLLAAYHLPVATMSRIMYRESRCRPGAYNRSGATGLLQIMRQWAGRWGVCVGLNLRSAVGNVACAARVYARQGLRAWALTR